MDQLQRSAVPISATMAYVAVAVALLLVNTLSSLAMPLYQDDFRVIYALDSLDWNLAGAFGRDLIDLGLIGFRPLWYPVRLVAWNLIGENPIALHVVAAMGHLAIGLVVARAARLTGGHRLHGAVALLLYFGSVVTRQTLFSVISFTPSDLFILLSLLAVLEGIERGWSPVKLAVSTVGLAAVAAFSKENGIAAPVCVMLLALSLHRRLTRQHLARIFIAHVGLLGVYALAYSSSQRFGGMSQSLSFLTEQGTDILKGVVISLGGPFSSVYFSLRAYGLSVYSTLVFVLLAGIAVAWLIWKAEGQTLRGIGVWLRGFLGRLVIVTALLIVTVLPYLPGRWFENRMLVPAFALGVFLWSVPLGRALVYILVPPLPGPGAQAFARGAAFTIPIALAGLGSGSPLTTFQLEEQGLDTQVETALEMRKLATEALARGIQNVCLDEFPMRGSAMRLGNAEALILYETKRQVRVHDSRMEDIEAITDCATFRYDASRLRGSPVYVVWPPDLQAATAPSDGVRSAPGTGGVR